MRRPLIGPAALLAAFATTGCLVPIIPPIVVRPVPAAATLALASPAVPTTPARSLAPAARLHISLESERMLAARPLPPPPARSAHVHLVVRLSDRALFVLAGRDTLLTANVAVASGLSLSYGDREWNFQTPKGDRRVLRKVRDPVWTPPDWHYAEAALEHHLRLARLPLRGVPLSKGRRLAIANGAVDLVDANGVFHELPVDEHIVFDGQLFIPPYGTRNRSVAGELGAFALDLGSGYMIHGTTDESEIASATTHGCIRVDDASLQWLFANIQVGTAVSIR